MITKDYKTEALKYLLPYLRTNKDVCVLLKAIGERYNDIQNSILYLLNSLDLQQARGIWLDFIGKEVGAYRDELDYGNFFCVNNNHINVEKDFYFSTSQLNPLNPISLKDAEFTQKILAYICTNNSISTRDEIIAIIKLITKATDVKLTFDTPQDVTIHLTGENMVITQNTINYIKNILTNGIYIKEIKINDKTN